MADQSEADFKVMVIMSYNRHLREIDCSLAIVGGLATAYSHGAESGAAPKCFLMVVGNITTTSIENKFTRTRAGNFSCPLFSNGRDGSR